MSITINTTPTEVALAGNKLLYEVASDNAITEEGTKAYWRFSFGENAPEDGQIFILSCDLFDVEFEFKTAPDESGNQLPIPAVPWVPATYSVIMQEAIAKNYYIAKYCDIKPVPNTASFDVVFRDYSDHDISHFQEVFYVTISDSQGVATTLNENFRIGVMVKNAQGVLGEDDKSPVMAIPTALLSGTLPDEIAVEFNIADYIRHRAQGDFSYPYAELFTQLVVWPLACLPYIALFYEKYGSVAEPTMLVYDSTRYAIPGGLDRTMLETIENDWFTDYLSAKKCLTWADDNRYVAINDIIRLYYCFKNDESVSLYVKYANNAEPLAYESEWFSVGDPVLCKTWSVVEAIIDPVKLLSTEQLNTAELFYVKLVDALGNDVSEMRTFNLVTQVPDQRLQFVFANSYEIAYDTLFAVGKAEFRIDLENYNVISINNNKLQSRSLRQDKISVNTGFLNFRALYYWQEFLQSSRRFLIRDGRRIPARVLSTDIFVSKNKEYNYALAFDIELDDRDEYRTSLPDASLFSDFFNSNGFSALSFGGGGDGGHIIINASNQAMGQRSKLKFTGDGVTVSDDSVNDTTVITISGGSGSGESMWEADGENNVRPINGKKVNVSHIDGLADVATSGDYTDLDNTPETTQTLTDAATITWDSVNGNIAFVTLGDNRIFDNISNPIVGRRYKLYVRQDANGSRLATFSAYYYFPGGIVPTLSASANAVDFFEFECTEAHLFAMVNFVPNIKAQP